MHIRACIGLCSLVTTAFPAFCCVEPVVVEDGALACGNGKDDDGDGKTDCADGDCEFSGACETNVTTCRNGIDDDKNGKADCEEPRCLADFCAPFPSECSPVPQSGCPIGMGCYPMEWAERPDKMECRIAGSGTTAVECAWPQAAQGPSDCAPGFMCTQDTVCASLCIGDMDCPGMTRCMSGPSIPLAECDIPCVPEPAGFLDCPKGLTCTSLHRYGFPYDQGGALWVCAYNSSGFAGTAGLDAPCDDEAQDSVPDRVCKSPYACVPDAVGDFRCRKVCLLDPVTQWPLGKFCLADQVCVALYPLDLRGGTLHLLGACLTP